MSLKANAHAYIPVPRSPRWYWPQAPPPPPSRASLSLPAPSCDALPGKADHHSGPCHCKFLVSILRGLPYTSSFPTHLGHGDSTSSLPPFHPT